MNLEKEVLETKDLGISASVLSVALTRGRWCSAALSAAFQACQTAVSEARVELSLAWALTHREDPFLPSLAASDSLNTATPYPVNKTEQIVHVKTKDGSYYTAPILNKQNCYVRLNF